MKIIILFFITLLFPYMSFSKQDSLSKHNKSFTIIIGNRATSDKSLIMMHNNTIYRNQMLSMSIIPRKSHSPSEFINKNQNNNIAQNNSSARYFWVKVLEQEFSDIYMNEFGVSIVSNSCNSRENRVDLTGIGVGSNLSRLVAEKSKNALSAVELMGELIEKYGYIGSGATYCIADKNNAWIVSVVRGRHWVAKKIDNEKIMIVSNNYVIDNVDLADEKNYKSSKDIITYAIKRGWYNPQKNKKFSFLKAYSKNAESYNSETLTINHVLKTKYNIENELMCQFIPKTKFDVKTLINEIEKGVCEKNMQSSIILHMRDLPSNIGATIWSSISSPCNQIYTPWYVGMDYLPRFYSLEFDNNNFINMYEDNLRNRYPKALYWDFLDFDNYIKENFDKRIIIYSPKFKKIQNKIFKAYNEFDNELQKFYLFYKLNGVSDVEKNTSEKEGEFSRRHHKNVMKLIQSRK